MKGVILAAGKGSRLFPVTHHIPKPLLPLANRITLAYAFDQLKSMGIHEICVVVGANEEAMRSALGHGDAFDVRLSYVRQNDPKGLAHAVGFAKDFVAGDDFVLYLGDAIYDQPFETFSRQFNESGCDNLNLVKAVEDPRRFGVANVNGSRIVKLVEKPAQPESNLAMAGMYIFGPAIWDVLPNLQPSARGEYEITDAIQMLVDQGGHVEAGVYTGNWFDTGTLDSFIETSDFLTSGAVVMGQDATLAGSAGRHVVLGEGCEVDCSMIEDSVVLPGAKVQVQGTIRHAVLGGHVVADGDLHNVVRWNDELA